MNLQEFISQTLEQIAEGIKEGEGHLPSSVHFEVTLVPTSRGIEVVDKVGKDYTASIVPKITFDVKTKPSSASRPGSQ